MRLRAIAVLAAIGLWSVACETNEGHRQEGDLSTRSPAHSASPGNTTGDGLPRDTRTGGAIDSNDLTPTQRIDAERDHQLREGEGALQR